LNSATGNVTVYRKNNKPALGPAGDSLDDFVAAPQCGAPFYGAYRIDRHPPDASLLQTRV
jgi:hypothetical protein